MLFTNKDSLKLFYLIIFSYILCWFFINIFENTMPFYKNYWFYWIINCKIFLYKLIFLEFNNTKHTVSNNLQMPHINKNKNKNKLLNCKIKL